MSVAGAFNHAVHKEDCTKPNIKVLRPFRPPQSTDPIRWGTMHANEKTEYTTKYLANQTYRPIEPILPKPQLGPNVSNEYNDHPSVYRGDFIKFGTSKPNVQRPVESLDFGPDEPNRVTTYRDTYPEYLAYEKRQTIAKRGDHWIMPPKLNLTYSTTYDKEFPAPSGQTRRSLIKRDLPYEPPDVGMVNATTHRSDFQWKAAKTRKNFGPQPVATVPTAFDSETHYKNNYVHHDAQHYKAAFDDLLNLPLSNSTGSKPFNEDDIAQIQRRRARPPSPQVPLDIEALITTRTNGMLESSRGSGSVDDRLRALKHGSSQPPHFATVYGRDYAKIEQK